MAILFGGVMRVLSRSNMVASKAAASVPKGFFAVYVGESEMKKRFRCLVPVSYLNEPSFQDLLHLSEQEFGFIHPMGGLTIPCSRHTFNDIISNLSR
ncbi:auxin-responsive protein SAUR20-like [Euphorbia lathyris]|uniref:auxin-responsive protein SAUR20-like n=1 Tax=Euphorbia lathyris TaxID=212925 RepID=UPI003313C7A0